jgi:hypothetical protein
MAPKMRTRAATASIIQLPRRTRRAGVPSPPLRMVLAASWALVVLATAPWGAAGTAGAAPEVPPDSVRFSGPVQVRGGSILSAREVRARLPIGPPGGGLPRSRVEDDLAGLGAVLLEAGRFESRLTLTVDSVGNGVLTVEDGPAARWDSLEASAAGPAPFPLRPARGASFDAGRFDRALHSWVDAATERGHPFASARIESLAVNGGRVRAGVRLDTGPYCRVEEVSFPGRTATRESFLRRWVGFHTGMPYRESDWKTARRRLEQVGLFASAGEPRVELRAAGGVRVVLPVEETKHNRLEGAVGYSGRTRAVTGLVDLQLGDLLGTGRRFAVRWERLQVEQSRLRLEAGDPQLGPLPMGVRLSLEQEVRDSTYTTAVFELLGEVSVKRDFTALAGVEWRRSVLGREPAERDRRLSSVFGGRWNTERPGTWSGGRLETTYRSGHTQVRPAGGGPESSLRLDRAETLAERFWSFGGLVVRAALSAAAVSRADSLPPSEALRFGGAATLRGFADESFAARRYAAGQLELGPAWPEARAYLFLDAAAWRPPERAQGDHDALGFGIGLAQESAGRRVVIDLAIPRGGSVADGRLHARVERRF